MNIEQKRALYLEKYGKEPHHKMTEKSIDEKLIAIGVMIPQNDVPPPRQAQATVVTSDVDRPVRQGKLHLVYVRNAQGEFKPQDWTTLTIETALKAKDASERLRFPEGSEWKHEPRKCKNC